MEADVLKQHNVAVLELCGKRLCALADNILGHLHFLAEQLGKSLRNRCKRKLGLKLTLGSAEM